MNDIDLINDIGVSDQEALVIVCKKIATVRAEIEHHEATLREYETERKASLKPTVKVLLKQPKITLLRSRLDRQKKALALCERAERELFDRIYNSQAEITTGEQT